MEQGEEKWFRVCAECGEEFEEDSSSLDFCPDCQLAGGSAGDASAEKICEGCGSPVLPPIYHGSLCEDCVEAAKAANRRLFDDVFEELGYFD